MRTGTLECLVCWGLSAVCATAFIVAVVAGFMHVANDFTPHTGKIAILSVGLFASGIVFAVCGGD
jgi:hypothetical protein